MLLIKNRNTLRNASSKNACFGKQINFFHQIHVYSIEFEWISLNKPRAEARAIFAFVAICHFNSGYRVFKSATRWGMGKSTWYTCDPELLVFAKPWLNIEYVWQCCPNMPFPVTCSNIFGQNFDATSVTIKYNLKSSLRPSQFVSKLFPRCKCYL